MAQNEEMTRVVHAPLLRVRKSTLLLALWYGGLVLGGTAVILSASPWGVGVRHDSLSYLTAAQSLSRGECLCWLGSGEQPKPLVHFGPLYPTLLALVTLLTPGVQEAARWTAAFLYGTNLAVWGGLVHLVTRRFWAGAVVSATLSVSPVLLEVHDAAMSEPLFLPLLALALLALTAYVIHGRRRDLWLAAAVVSLALLTRYAAAPLLLLGVGAVAFLGAAPLRQRLWDSARFGFAASAPVAIWLTRNYLLAGTATNRTLRWHPITIDEARTFLQVVTAWFTPAKYSHWLEGAVLLGILLGLTLLFWRSRSRGVGEGKEPATLGLLLVAWFGLYTLHIAVSKSLMDDSVPIHNRMFSPVSIAFIALAVLAAAIISQRPRGTWLLLPIAALLLAGPLPYMTRSYRQKYASMQAEGVGFSGRAWRQSESMAWIRSLPENALVYSNRALMIQFLIGRPAYQLPEGFDSVKAEARDDFEEQLARMRADLRRAESYLVVFDPERPASPSDLPDVFEEGLRLFRTTRDGFVLKDPTSEEAS